MLTTVLLVSHAARAGETVVDDGYEHQAARPHQRPQPAQSPDAALLGDVHGAVLIGGGSRRMGRDKAELHVDGATLLARAVRSLEHAIGDGGPPVTVVGPHPDVARPVPVRADAAPTATRLPAGTRWATDLRIDTGPLAGLEAALATAATAQPVAAAVLVVGVDHPWLVPGVLARLVTRLRAAEPTTAGVVLGTADGPQPLLGAYRTTALATVAALLDAGERRLRSLTDHLDVEVLAPSAWRELDPLGVTAVDVDDPAALAAAAAWHARAHATAAPTPAEVTRASTTPAGRTPGDGADGDAPHRRAGREVLRVRPASEGAVRPETGAIGRTEVDRGPETVVGETALHLHLGGPGEAPAPVVTLLCSPGHATELALGWLLTEGHVPARDLLAAVVEHDPTARTTGRPAAVTIRLPSPGTDPTAAAAPRTVMDPRAAADPLAGTGLRVPWHLLARLPEELRLAQSGTGTTGGTHAVGVFDRDGRLVTLRQDIGRHNALDTVIGAHLHNGVWPAEGLDDLVCVLSSRIGVALVNKAASAGLAILAGVGTASDLAIDTAEQLGITLLGQLRAGAATVYTHPHRIVFSEDAQGRDARGRTEGCHRW